MNRRGRGRGGAVNPQPASTRPITVTKDPTMGLMSRYRDMDPVAVRRTVLASGSVIEEVQIRSSSPYLQEVKEGPDIWLSVQDAEPVLARAKRAKENQVLLGRRVNRLGEEYKDTPLSQLSEDNMRILRMTQKVYNTFRGPQE